MAQPHGHNAGTTNRLLDRSPEQVWGALERLPPVIRAVLWTTPFDMDEVEIEELVRQGRAADASDRAIVTVLEQLIREDVAENARDWGPGYPRMRFTPIVARPGRSGPRRRVMRHYSATIVGA